MTRKYEVLVDSRLEPNAKAGTIVYDLVGIDYGMADMDSNATGIEHVPVTLNEKGEYPFFTIPKAHLKVIG